MTGGLMQLVAYGAQDIYLTGNPVITYFKTVYRRHTNFAMESIMQTFNGPVNFGSTVTSLIDRSGDLVSGLYLQTTLPDITATATADGGHVSLRQRWIDNVGHYLIKDVHMSIGGQKIDQQCGDWLEVWCQLTVPAGQMVGYREMIGQDPRNPLGMNTGLQRDRGPGSTITGRTIFIPLQFWFCRNIGLALPLIALQYHEVKVHLTLRPISEVMINHRVGKTTVLKYISDPDGLANTNIWADYIYLDTDERRRFAQVSHEYLIEQVQKLDAMVLGTALSADIDLKFNHPVKELVWVSRHVAATDNGVNQWSNYTTTPAIPHAADSTGILVNTSGISLSSLGAINQLDHIVNNVEPINLLALTNHSHIRPVGSSNQIGTATLYLNGNKRFATRPGTYFNWIQCREHHLNIPLSPGINVYSFAHKPEQHQPSGTCNFSRLITSKLSLTFNEGRNLASGVSLKFKNTNRYIQIFAVNYNILRVMSGMAGIAYPE
jgi:hypothetical protein